MAGQSAQRYVAKSTRGFHLEEGGNGGVFCVLYMTRVLKLTWFPGKRCNVFTFPGEGGWNEYTRVE